MAKKKILPSQERERLLEELHGKYGVKQGFWQRLTYWRKRYFWIIVVRGAKALKRFLDIVFGSFLLIVLSPLMLLIAFLIKIRDFGPVLYSSHRVGQWGREFVFYKFRTMRSGAEQERDQLSHLSHHGTTKSFKIKKDPRVTLVGKILRKTSLDELPQLWNVVKGDMSLVGPRPPLPNEVAHYDLAERRRLEVKPGITCIWQVSGRSELSFEQQVQLDIQYIESRSLWLDFKLLLRTIPAVLFGRGAY